MTFLDNGHYMHSNGHYWKIIHYRKTGRPMQVDGAFHSVEKSRVISVGMRLMMVKYRYYCVRVSVPWRECWRAQTGPWWAAPPLCVRCGTPGGSRPWSVSPDLSGGGRPAAPDSPGDPGDPEPYTLRAGRTRGWGHGGWVDEWMGWLMGGWVEDKGMNG